EGKTIATSYPNILKKFLDENNISANIHVITGSVEIAPGISLADAIFDIVSSGSTLITNNLKEVEIVVKSEALLIATPNLSDDKKEILNNLLFRLHAVMEADHKKYVMMNAPIDKVDDIVSVLPGIKSPTIMPLADKKWCSIHTVLERKSFWDIIGQLKERGAQGILVLPIEKMVL
ncbi:MAG: ATP phosphoribosyltransferase, partial [Bacteroidaceae bacterium]